MVNSKNPPQSGYPRQDDLPFEGNFDLIAALKTAISATLSASKWSREQVVERMNNLIERAGGRRPLTLESINKWAAPGQPNYPSLALLTYFCAATDSNLALEAYARAFSGCRLISEEDYALLVWARSQRDLRLLKKHERNAARAAGVE